MMCIPIGNPITISENLLFKTIIANKNAWTIVAGNNYQFGQYRQRIINERYSIREECKIKITRKSF